MKIVWDERKRQANLAKHGLDFSSLRPDFFEWAVIRPAIEPRMMAIGRLEGVLVVVVVFRALGSEAISVVSMRPASKRERMIYDEF